MESGDGNMKSWNQSTSAIEALHSASLYAYFVFKHEVNFPSLVEDGFFQHRVASPMKTTMWGYPSSLVILYVFSE